MAKQYVNSPEKDFSLGIDARSAENQIEPGFVKDLLNADIVEKRVRKRRGYQGYGGNLPFRATKIEYKQASQQVCFTLDSAVSLDAAVSLETVRSSPLVVYGRSSVFTGSDGPFIDTDSVHYYPAFTVPLRKAFTAPSGTETVPADEHGFSTTSLFIETLESNSLDNRSYNEIEPNSISIDETSLDVSLDYTTYVDRNVFVVFSDKSTVTGSSYVHAALAVGTGVQTISIPAATHSLSNFNIIAQIYQDTGTSRVQVQTDSFVIQNDGDVLVTLTNGTGSSQDYYVILSAAPVANLVTGSVGANASGTVVIPDVTSPWIFYGIYLEVTPGGDKELVFADSIDYDDTTREVTLSFTNMASSARNFIVFYEYGSVRSNELCVSDTVTTSGVDESPQVSIWGLDHTEVYLDKLAREAWVSHVDSYRRSGEQRLISGLGGNLFSSREFSESATQYAYPQLYPSLFARTSTSQILAPLFWQTGEEPARSRGYITGDDSALHSALVTSVSYNGTNTEFVLSIPNMAILDSTGTPTTVSAVISTTAGLEDFLTVQSMSWARHNGTFRILAVTSGVDSLTITADVPDNSTDFDDLNTGGEASLNTDHFNWTASAPFIPGDVLVSDSLGNTTIATVVSSLGSVTATDGIVDIVEVAAGVLFNGQRTSSVIPLREAYPSAVSSVTNVVRGDMLSYEGIPRQLRVLYVNPDSNRAVSISAAGGVATVSSAGTTSALSVGHSVLLLQAGIYTGTQVITSILSESTFSFATTETDSETGVLVGKTVEIDEQLNWEDTPGDSQSLTVEQRWIPVESPDDSYDLTPNTHVRYLDSNSYSNQPFLRSTMVQDTLFLTNGDDEVYKFDGTNLYRAGTIAWDSGLFLTQDTSGSNIVTDLRSVTYSAITAAQGKLTVTAATSNVLPEGTQIRLSGSTQTYTVSSYQDDGTIFYLLVDRALDSGVSATGTASEIAVYRYYRRLNAVDANNNIIASAVTGFQDNVVELTADAAVLLKSVGLPAWDVYDYSRLELEIYRTKKNQAAPFYKITTIPLSFNNTEGYVTYRDSFSDSDLINLDKVSTALKGTELGTAWSDPLRAKYVTSIGNRLILGHIRDYPQLDLQIVAPASTVDADFDGSSFLFRRDNTDTGTTTNMVDRVRYEFVDGSTGTVSSPTILADQLQITTSSATGAVVGDWIYLTYSSVATSSRDLTYCGWYQIAACTGSTVTINISGAAVATSYPDTYCTATDPTDVPVLLGTDGSLGMVNGDSFDIFDTMRRMSMAVNSTQRMVDVSLSGMESYTPWLTSRSGNDVGQAGRLIVRQPRADNTTMEVVVSFSNVDLFVNSIRRVTGDSISASVRTYPSRLIASYENYSEIFDNPTSVLDTESDSAIDVNSADGQEITGVIPFFGQAAFTAAQQAAILVVFKTNSIYLVDINQKSLGNQAVQRIETEGLGCTAPYSIAVTKKGIIFANESGIYCLRRDQSIEYIGKYMERDWTERVDLGALQIAHGHHYGVGRVYKLSVPLTGDISSTGYVENSEAFVYNHTNEDIGTARVGAWGRYDNHPAIGWANLGSDAFFASTQGRVFLLRNTASVEDFRDDSTAINMVLETRPNDFGNSGIRKIVDCTIVHYRVGATASSTAVAYSLDLTEEYLPATGAILKHPNTVDGVSDVPNRKIISIRHDTFGRRCIYFSLQITNDGMDEAIEIAGLDFQVAGLSTKGITDAQSTK